MSDFFKGADESICEAIRVPKPIHDPATGELFNRKPKRKVTKPSTVLIDLQEMVKLDFDLDMVSDISACITSLNSQVRIETKTLEVLTPLMNKEQLHYATQSLKLVESQLADAKRFRTLYNTHLTEIKAKGQKDVNIGIKHLLNTLKGLSL